MRRRATARIAAATVMAVAAVLVLSSSPRGATSLHRATMVRSGDLELRVVRAGTGDPIVLLHGFGESLISWQSVFDALKLHGDVIALDLPGFGLSSKPASGYQTDSMALAVLRALDAMGVHGATIVGHSLGGAVAAAMAAEAPAEIRGLVLVDAALVATPWLVPDSTEVGRAAELVRGAIARYEILRTHFTDPHAPSWLAETDSALRYAPSEDSAYARALAAVLREFDFSWLTAERAARIDAPALILWGQFDQVVRPDDGRRLAHAMRHARFQEIARSWHRPHVERPAETARAIAAFVATLAPRVLASP